MTAIHSFTIGDIVFSDDYKKAVITISDQDHVRYIYDGGIEGVTSRPRCHEVLYVSNDDMTEHQSALCIDKQKETVPHKLTIVQEKDRLNPDLWKQGAIVLCHHIKKEVEWK